MKWLGGKKALFFSVLLLFSFGLVSEQTTMPVGSPLVIYESELNKLLENATKLGKLNLEQRKQLENLTAYTENQKKELIALRSELQASQIQIEGLLKDLDALKAQLASSQAVLVELRIQLQKAEDSYKSLWESFLMYQKETERLVSKLKSENIVLKWLSSFTSVGTIVFIVFWAIEKFFVR